MQAAVATAAAVAGSVLAEESAGSNPAREAASAMLSWQVGRVKIS